MDAKGLPLTAPVASLYWLLLNGLFWPGDDLEEGGELAAFFASCEKADPDPALAFPELRSSRQLDEFSKPPSKFGRPGPGIDWGVWVV